MKATQEIYQTMFQSADRFLPQVLFVSFDLWLRGFVEVSEMRDPLGVLSEENALHPNFLFAGIPVVPI